MAMFRVTTTHQDVGTTSPQQQRRSFTNSPSRPSDQRDPTRNRHEASLKTPAADALQAVPNPTVNLIRDQIDILKSHGNSVAE